MNKKPFICMNLTQEEWEMLNDIPYEVWWESDDLYIDVENPDPIKRDLFVMMSTKPSWA